MTTLRQHRRLVLEAATRYEADHPDDFDVAMRAAAIGWLIRPHGSPAEQVVYLKRARALVNEVVKGQAKDGTSAMGPAEVSLDVMVRLVTDEAEAEDDVRAMEEFGLDFRTWSAQQKAHRPA